MTVPAEWATLDPAAKRERLLQAAEALFARDGLAAPMPAVAAAAGAGVGSLYRQFPSKEALLAALALKRLAHVEAELETALADPDPWNGFERFVWRTLEPYACDDLIAGTIAAADGYPELDAARAAVKVRIERLLTAARQQGTLRDDATVTDVHLLFVAGRAARPVADGAWRRMVELTLDGLRQ